MRIVRTKVYKFSELSEDAKNVALQSMYDINVNYDWWQYIYEDAANVGLEIAGFDLDRNRHATGSFNLASCEVAQNIFNNHGIGCNTFDTATNFMDEWQPIFNDYMNESSENYESRESETQLQDIEDEFLKSLLEDYSIILQKECEYLQSETAIIQTIESNEYEFLQNGKRF